MPKLKSKRPKKGPKLNKTDDGQLILSRHIEYDPVDESRKMTAIYFTEYSLTKGLITRVEDYSQLIGICKQKPQKVLAQLFPEYIITRFNGYGFYGAHGPMKGLEIVFEEPSKAIRTSLKHLLDIEEMQKLKRRKKPSKKETRKIIEYVEDKDNCALDKLAPEYKQIVHDKGEIIDILRNYLTF